MVDLDIIKPVDEPNDWVNRLVIVENSYGKLRICLGPRPLNKPLNMNISNSAQRKNSSLKFQEQTEIEKLVFRILSETRSQFKLLLNQN